MSNSIARKVVQSFQRHAPSDKPAENLTKRETDVLGYVARGYSTIAEALGHSTGPSAGSQDHLYETARALPHAGGG